MLSQNSDIQSEWSCCLSNEYPNLGIWIVSTTAEDHERMGRKRHKTDMDKFIKVITIYYILKQEENISSQWYSFCFMIS